MTSQHKLKTLRNHDISRIKRSASASTNHLSPTKFAIDSKLLGDPNRLAWSNLGYWRNSRSSDEHTNPPNDYIAACQQLANIVGSATQLTSTDKLLDLGCGQGASLHYWSTAFSVKHITAFELQTTCIEKINQASLPQLDAIYHASFSHLPLPNAQLEHAFDVVLCVDAAYHAPLNDFLAVNQAALKPHGRIGFTTLIRPESTLKNNRVFKKLKPYLFNLAAIPQQQLNTEIEVIDALKSFGFRNIQIKHLDHEVLNGFAQYIKRQPPRLNPNNFSQWLKITLTAKLCGFLYQHKLVHYSVVSAEYLPD